MWKLDGLTDKAVDRLLNNTGDEDGEAPRFDMDSDI